MQPEQKLKQKRNRRFFTETFKKELVWKIKTKQMAIAEAEAQYAIPKQLLQTWLVKFTGIGQLPGHALSIPNELQKQVDVMLERIIVHRLENLLASMDQFKEAVNSSR